MKTCWKVIESDIKPGSIYQFGIKFKPWESVTAVSIAIVKAILYGIYNGKKIAFVRFSMSMVFIFKTYIIVDYLWKIN